MTAAIRVLLVDDDPLVRAGLTLMLDGHVLPDGHAIAIVGEAADGRGAGAHAHRRGVAHTVDGVRGPLTICATSASAALRASSGGLPGCRLPDSHPGG